jgi:hypothetical protein
MNATRRARELRKKIVERLEAFNERNDIPEYWRIKDDQVERGTEISMPHHLPGTHPCSQVQWRTLEFLSPYLCLVHQDERYRLDEGVSF